MIESSTGAATVTTAAVPVPLFAGRRKEFEMVEIIAEEITISPDFAAGEIVEGVIQIEGKRAGVFMAASVILALLNAKFN
jgi:hypothetical protein